MLNRLWNALTRSIDVVNCIAALQQGDVALATKFYSRIEDSSLPRYVALGGRIRLMDGDINGARLFFERAASLASKKKNKRYQYVYEYCRFYLSQFDKDGRHEQHRIKALSLKPSKTAALTLPLAPKNWDISKN